MKICPNCSQTAADDKVFCGSDGTRLIPVAANSSDAPPIQIPPVFAPPPLSQTPQDPVPPPNQPPPARAMTPATVAPPTRAQSPPQQQTHDPNAPIERIQCKWCQAMNEKTAVSCRTCGAPLDIKDLVSESGWREAPRIKDMTEIRFGRSTCQVEGEIVPVAEMNLAPNDSVFFEHHVLLWKDDATAMSVMSLQGGIKRALAGMPFVISIANGPGRVAF